MNINLGSAVAHLHVDASGVRQGVSQAGDFLNELEPTVRNMWWGLRGLGVAFGAVAGAVGTAFAMAANSAMQWESAMAGVERTTYDSNASMEENLSTLNELEQGLRNLASVRPMEAVGIAGIAEEAGALGVAKQDIVGFTGVVADLASTTDLTAETAATNVARIAGLTGVAGTGFENLASSILESGRATAATETDIVNLANRIAGVAGVVGLSADQVIGLSAAVRSAGVQVEAGGTAMQKTFIDMQQAVSNNSDELEIWATASGMSVQEFAALFKQDAAAALVAFLQGMGKVQAGGGDVIKMLEALGITEQRQLRTLLSLSRAENQTANQNLRLSNILGISNEAWIENTALQEVAARRYATLEAQLGILKNRLFEVASLIGEAMLPALKLVVSILGHFIEGLRAMPAPLRTMYVALFAIIGVVTALAAAALILIPQLVLMRAALGALGVSGFQAAGGLAAASGAAVGAAGAASGAGALVGRFGGFLGKAGKAAGALGAVLAVATVATTIFGSKQDRAAQSADNMVVANQGLVTAIQQQSQGLGNSADEWVAHQLQMTRSIVVAEALGYTLRNLIDVVTGKADPKFAKRLVDDIGKAEKKGVSGADELGDALYGLNQQYKASYDAVIQLNSAGVGLAEGNEDLVDSMNELIDAAEDEKQAIDTANRARMDMVSAMFSQRNAARAVQEAQEELAEAQKDVVVTADELEAASIKVAKAYDNQRNAAQKVRDAEEALLNARADQRKAEKNASRDLADSRDAYLDSLDEIQEREEELAELRGGKSIENIIEATNDLRNAQLRLARANMDVSDAEWYLNYLREEGAGARDIEEAEMLLAEARQEVNNAQEDLKDSEEELRRAREGASIDEIRDAERALEKARRDSRRALDEIQDRETELRDLRRNIAADTAYKEAMRDLVDARRAEREAILGVRDAERDLRELRSGEKSEKKDPVEAAENLEESLYRLAQANTEARKAQLEANGVTVDAGTEAQILADELEKLYSMAPNNGALGRMKQMVGILRQAKPVDMSPKSDKGPSLGGAALPDIGMPVIDPGPLNDYGDAFEKLNDKAEKSKSTFDTVKGAISNFVSFIAGQALGKIIISKLAGAFAGGAIGTALGGPIGALAGFVIGLLVSLLLQPLIDKLISWAPGAAKALWGWLQNVPGYVTGFIESAIGFITQLPTRMAAIFTEWAPRLLNAAVDFLVKLPERIAFLIGFILGVVVGLPIKMSMIFVEWGPKILGAVIGFMSKLPGIFAEWIKTALKFIITEGAKMLNWWKDLPGKIWNLVKSLGGTLKNFAVNMIKGMITGIGATAPGLMNWFIQLPNKVLGFIRGLPGSMMNRAKAVIQGFINGINQIAPQIWRFFTALPGNIMDRLRGLPGQMLQMGKDVLKGFTDGIGDIGGSIVNGITGGVKSAFSFLGIGSPSKLMKRMGGWTTQGFIIGIQSLKAKLAAAAIDVARAATKPFEDQPDLWERAAAMSGSRAVSLSEQAGRSAGAAAARSVTTSNGGDTINIQVGREATATQIVNEAMWRKRVRSRS